MDQIINNSEAFILFRNILEYTTERKKRSSVSSLDEPDVVYDKDEKSFRDSKSNLEGTSESVKSTNLITWEDVDISDHPKEWPTLLKIYVTTCVCLLTIATYMGASIITSGLDEIKNDMHVGHVTAMLGLSLFIVGYSVGPMFFAPLTEIPQVGRQKVYLITLVIYICLQIPTALCSGIGALLPLRFLAGFFGSPALAAGGATITDMWDSKYAQYFVTSWSLCAFSGPALGPLFGAIMVVAKSWRWQFWFLMMLSAAVFILFFVFVPETSASNILYRKTKRLRKTTNNSLLQTPEELQYSQLKITKLLTEIFLRPIILSIREPIVLSLNLYLGLVYSLMYLWFEAFPIVYLELYHFTLIENGLTYLGILIGTLLPTPFYFYYLHKVLIPKLTNNSGRIVPEEVLRVSFPAAFFFPVCLFWFGWTAQRSINYFSSLVSTLLYAAGSFLIFQTCYQYLASSYPNYIASVYAGNNLCRSLMAASFPLFARAMFKNTGPSYAPVGWGCTILGIITCIMFPIPFFLYTNGLKLRTRSNYATH
ncbi:caffeine resistance protein [Schizosaccharomyces octosporus yFS286]|uniref:Caffeine resistance protein n=1 Tax=Schizosaccharomyces octosporus (strain yFS286) TaxID=483514 RepID=S9R4Z6_SCHOY|nr:caffeine resistance protein [Schizosaccharomyces octosporus yFS286]EPX73420.1 caffeine resistance protein [Schizosaccharomyces octosporus yFS286]